CEPRSWLWFESFVMHQEERNNECRPKCNDPHHVGHAEICELRHETAGDRPREHCDAGSDRAFCEDTVESLFESSRPKAIDQPSLGRSAKKGKPQTQQHRDDCPRPKRPLCFPEP